MARPIKRFVKYEGDKIYLECLGCHIIKESSEYYKGHTSLGFRTKCKSCIKKYVEDNKEHLHNWRKDYYQKNKEKRKIYNKEYRKINSEKNKEYKKKIRKERGYTSIHNKTIQFARKNNIDRSTCCICGGHSKIEMHHPDYNKWYEVCIVCNGCHKEIHSGYTKCPIPINILKLKKEQDE